MRAFRRFSVASTSITSVIVALAILTVAQTAQGDKSSKVQIKNFGCINENFYRGAQPKEQDYADLAAMGVKTIIDLQRDGNTTEQGLVEAQGMKFYRIGMSDKNQPSAEQAELFLKIVNDPANQPVFVHCLGWSADQAFLEMKRYDFDYGMGHGSLKRYVFDFYSHIEEKGLVVTNGNK